MISNLECVSQIRNTSTITALITFRVFLIQRTLAERFSDKFQTSGPKQVPVKRGAGAGAGAGAGSGAGAGAGAGAGSRIKRATIYSVTLTQDYM